MSSVKTAISLNEDLFRKAESARKQMKMSRSKLVGQALSEFLERREDKHILDQINEAYAKQPETPEELDFLRKASRSLGRTIEDEKW